MRQKRRTDKTHSLNAVSAVTRVFMENSAYLQTFLRRFLQRQQDIEDVAQEAYLKAYSAEQSKDIEHPRAFLFTIAKNIAINELRKKTNQIMDSIEECKTLPTLHAAATPENEFEARRSLGVYCEAVAALPEMCRRVYLLRRVHGLKQKEIADSLGISLRMVEKHLQKGTLACRAFINERNRSETGNTGYGSSGTVSRESKKL